MRVLMQSRNAQRMRTSIIFKAGSLYNIPKVFAALVATIALALALTWAVGKLERVLTPWRASS